MGFFDMREIQLTRGYVALVDDEDYEWLNSFKWCANVQKNGYVAAIRNKSEGCQFIKMSRMILSVTNPRILVDHRDGNPLNNQRSNLRACNDRQNNCNVRSAKNSTSNYLGVSFHKGEGKYRTKEGVKLFKSPAWRATIFKDYKQISLGRFQSETEAALAYNRKAIELHGEFANLNIIQ